MLSPINDLGAILRNTAILYLFFQKPQSFFFHSFVIDTCKKGVLIRGRAVIRENTVVAGEEGSFHHRSSSHNQIFSWHIPIILDSKRDLWGSVV